MTRDIDEVWSLEAVLAACVSGALFTAYLWWVHIRRPAINGRALPLLVFVDILMGAFLFTVSQVVAALWIGDAGWVRVMSRFGMWVPFAAAVALLLWVAIRARHRRSHL